MSDYSQGPGWWQASDGKWYPPDDAPPPAAPGPFTAPAAGAPPAYGVPVAQQQQKNGLALAAMICGIVGLAGGLVTCGILAPVAIVAVVLGHIALGQIKKNPEQQASRSFALTGVITGWIAIGAGVILGIILIIVGITADEIDDGINSDPSDGICNEDRFIQDPDC
jgi:hypothetical protein